MNYSNYSMGEAFVRVLLRRSYKKIGREAIKKAVVGILQVMIEDSIRIILPFGLGSLAISVAKALVEAGELGLDSIVEVQGLDGTRATYQVDIDPVTDIAVARTPDLITSPLEFPQTLLTPFSDPTARLNLDYTLLQYYNHGLGKQETMSDLYSFLQQEAPPSETSLHLPSLSCILCGSTFHLSPECPSLKSFDPSKFSISTQDLNLPTVEPSSLATISGLSGVDLSGLGQPSSEAKPLYPLEDFDWSRVDSSTLGQPLSEARLRSPLEDWVIALLIIAMLPCACYVASLLLQK